jgi:hypothetical protein
MLSACDISKGLLCHAPVVKLAYTQGSGPCGRKAVEVQLLSGAPFSGRRFDAVCNRDFSPPPHEIDF